MLDERRDNRRRADCLCRLMKRLLDVEGGLHTADFADNHVPLDAAHRILRRFAFKGFVRHEQNRWFATRLLVGCPLVVTEGWP